MLSELKRIQFAREMVLSVGKECTQQTRLEILISNYNLLNSYSLVAHPVGLHCDFFGCEESLENKVLLVNEARKDTCSRGGALTMLWYLLSLIGDMRNVVTVLGMWKILKGMDLIQL